MMQFTDRIFMLVLILCFFGYVWAIKRFCKSYLEISRRKELLFTALLFWGWVLLGILNERYVVSYIVYITLHHIIFIWLVIVLFRGDVEKKTGVAAVLVTITTLVGNFNSSLFSCFALLAMYERKKVFFQSVLNRWEYGIFDGILFGIVGVIIYWMSKSLNSVFYGKLKKWYVMLAIPLFAVTVTVDVANWGASRGIMVRSSGNMGVFYDMIFSYVEILVLTVLSMFATGFYIYGMNRIDLEQKKAAQYQSQISAYKMLEQQHSRQERLRHDMKNHIIALSGLLEDKEWEKMNDYLKEMGNSASLRSGDELTGSRVVDALLYQKREKAEQKGILWQCDVRIPKKCRINEFDLCILFGNLLDNAVEACEAIEHTEAKCEVHRFINIEARKVNSIFLLEVRNSTTIQGKKQIGMFDNEKLQPRGIGLSNVNDVLQKYSGGMNMQVEQGVFSIFIMIPFADAV